MERRIEVAASRLPGWLTRFSDQHPGTVTDAVGNALRLQAPDGATARITAWPTEPPDQVEAMRDWARGPHALSLILVRRGGWTVGAARGDELTAHRTGRRYVQSRTAAGGWSQQRFARRRGNQADALVLHVAEAAAALLPERPDGVVLGGDRALATAVLDELPTRTGQRALPELPRRELYDLPDPRLVVLRTALARARSAQIRIDDPTRG
ncbi:acVLRF1 family peptidyl-tRNA hydrolase [Ruania alba]|uniref:Actinobacteria/chloroflexi VLRF1 release factor domain-containing protein n=1 Tax=Ruania alba TaxID=648782 RepID=A0A1H5MWV5_9MICO|nr:acVLRF1 family peptidyl-tRNA hydrolase [Ruania alba]SEE93640.1 hypothetical protein SAMN04488554_3702 [Ruania alba]